MSTKASGRMVGGLILLAFVFYGGGSALVDSASGTPAVLSEAAGSQTQMAVGALLMLINCAIVASIGVVAFPVVKRYHQPSAYAYLVTRVFEAVMLAVGVVFLLLLVPLGKEYIDAGASDGSVLSSLARVAQDGSQYAYWAAMTGLGLGSLLFCRVLLHARLVPRFLAVWGLVGYAILAAGGMLEFLGYGVGLAMSVPGGLFEVALGALLVAKGFPERPNSDGRQLPSWGTDPVPMPAGSAPGPGVNH